MVLFDPNGRTERGRVYSDEHVAAVYDRYIEQPFLSKADCPIEHVLIVCHSAGGMATTRLLNERTKFLTPRIRGVAGTDTFFGRASTQRVQALYRKHIVNWVTSREPLGTILSESVPKRVSAGHTAHEYTSAAAMRHIFNFFDAMLTVNGKEAVKDKSLGTMKGSKEEEENEETQNAAKSGDDAQSKGDDGSGSNGKEEEDGDHCAEPEADKMEVDKE